MSGTPTAFAVPGMAVEEPFLASVKMGFVA